jgi:DeoR/GlpR family transcriptional regulator of sugar metabolism
MKVLSLKLTYPTARSLNMSQKERLEQIKEWLSIHYEMSIEEIMKQFQVSRDTARRDLVKLEEDGDIVRIKGGAILPSHRYQVSRYQERDITASKERIAKKACSFIHEQDSLLLDTSTTIELVARYMGNRCVTVVTNSIDIMILLSEHPDMEVYMAGGKFNPYHRNFIGPHTAEELRKYKVDKLFIGTCGIGADGLTSPDEGEAYVKKSMIQAANQVIVVTDHTKFHKEFFHKVCDLSEIDVIITDQSPGKELEQKLKDENVELIIVQDEETRD